jgi:hypothetical protein
MVQSLPTCFVLLGAGLEISIEYLLRSSGYQINSRMTSFIELGFFY